MPQRPAKVTRPHPSDLVRREKALAMLTDHGARALWLRGPPGAGKTALANLWLDALGTPADACAWLQVDATDHDPAGTFHYLGLATPGGAEGLPKADAEQLTALETFARTFFRAWFGRFPEGAVVVLDDCHAADHVGGFATILSVLLDSLPAHVRLLCLSRAEPPNALARAVAYRTLGVIGPDALLLPEADAIALARARGLDDADRAAALLEKSEGWLAGFTLMVEIAIHGTETPAFGTDPDRETLFGFFVTEILASVPTALRGGLARMAEMPDITLEEAAILGGGPAAAELLERLHERRLFIDRRPLTTADGSRLQVFRFHALLAGFLGDLLARDLPSADVAALRVHGAGLLEARGSIEDAFALVRRAQAWQDATRIVLTRAEALLGQGRWETVTGWIMAIPRPSAKRNRGCSIGGVWRSSRSSRRRRAASGSVPSSGSSRSATTTGRRWRPPASCGRTTTRASRPTSWTSGSAISNGCSRETQASPRRRRPWSRGRASWPARSGSVPIIRCWRPRRTV